MPCAICGIHCGGKHVSCAASNCYAPAGLLFISRPLASPTFMTVLALVRMSCCRHCQGYSQLPGSYAFYRPQFSYPVPRYRGRLYVVPRLLVLNVRSLRVHLPGKSCCIGDVTSPTAPARDLASH